MNAAQLYSRIEKLQNPSEVDVLVQVGSGEPRALLGARVTFDTNGDDQDVCSLTLRAEGMKAPKDKEAKDREREKIAREKEAADQRRAPRTKAQSETPTP